MDTLDRFLVREYLLYFIVLLLGLSALYLGIDFFSNVWNLKIPMNRIAQLYFYKIPTALQQFLPVACLMATLLVLTNMSRQNEVLALYAGGIGPFRLISTFIAMVAIICTIAFLVFDSISPIYAQKQMMVKSGLDPDAEPIINFGKNRFWYRSGRILYNVGRFVPETNTLQDVNVYVLGNDFHVLQKVHAKQAVYKNEDWELQDGVVIAYPIKTHFPLASKFEIKKALIPEKPDDFKTLRIREDTMKLRDLRKYIARNKEYGFDTTGQEVHYHERIALVFTPLIFVLIGFPYATRPLKTYSMAKSIGYCFFIVFIYLVMFRFALPLGKGGQVPPVVAGWGTNMIFFIYSIFGIVRKPTL